MDMLKGKTLRKILLAILIGGNILAVTACGRVKLNAAAGQTEAGPTAEQMEQEQTAAEQMAAGQTKAGQAETGQAEQTQTELTGTKDTENTADILNVGFDELPVVYSLDNSTRIMESKAGVFTGDWDNDGVEDTLEIETMEREGSDMIRKLELALSGCPDTYIIENADCDFIDIVSGNFDADQETEILLLFDMRSAGANGCCGLQLLDKASSEYVNAVDGFFTGFDYTAEVTGWYYLEILQGKEQDHIRLKQYIAGEDMTDHAGDMVTVLSLENGGLTMLDEKCVGKAFGTE